MPANLKDPLMDLPWNCSDMSSTTNNTNVEKKRKNKKNKNKCLMKQESWSTYHNIPLKKLMGVAIDALPLRASVDKFGGIEQVRSLHRWQQVREDLNIESVRVFQSVVIGLSNMFTLSILHHIHIFVVHFLFFLSSFLQTTI